MGKEDRKQWPPQSSKIHRITPRKLPGLLPSLTKDLWDVAQLLTLTENKK
jgi:hypothetical protein